MTETTPARHTWLYRMMEQEAWGKPGLSPVNTALVVLVVCSFVALALETEPSTPAGLQSLLGVANIGVIAVFALEYGVRVIVAGENPRFRGLAGRLRYIVSFHALADLMAFAPEAILLAQGDQISAQQAAVLKALRLLRLFKIARYVPAFDIFTAAIRRSWGQLGVALALALAFVYVGALILYFVEGPANEAAFGSIPRALWWAVVTLTTVGYGDVYPMTAAGRLAGAVIAVAGVGIVALPAGILASAFSDEIRERNQNRKPSCPKPPGLER